MADSDGSGGNGWHLVVAHPATEIREERQIEEWERSKGGWSGIGKHPTNWADHKKLHVSQEKELGSGSYGTVQRITFSTVTMARKHVKPRRGLTVEKLREEANAMENLAHKHILKLVGTYTLRSHLYLLLYPAATCDLSRFLEDIDDIRSESCADREDAFKRLRALGLKDIGTIEDLKNPGQQKTATGFLQQILGCITEAVAFVHRKDIRHRDLKPKNILLSAGRVYLADFGIARNVRDSENSITSGRCGTPSWIAPEVHEEYDHHMAPADVFSLGCIFLNVATVMYGESLEIYEEIMKERDWAKKYERLPGYLGVLRKRAVNASLPDEEEYSFDVKNVVGLVERMLRFNPDNRPTVDEVHISLVELGGLDQIYHLSCCHKRNASLTQVINSKFQTLHNTNASLQHEITTLKATNTKQQDRLIVLEENEGTWEHRLDNERKRMAERIETLKRNHESEIRALEDQLKNLESANRQRRPASHNRGKHKLPGALHVYSTSVNNPIPPTPNTNPPKGPKAEDGNLTYSKPPLPTRKPSGIPILMPRPSTPISVTPNRPTYVRDAGSNSSTLVSSVHSTFSRGSAKTNESFSSVESNQKERNGEESPTIRVVCNKKDGAEKSTMVVVKELVKKEKDVVKPEKPSWANMVAKVAEKVR